MDSRRVSLIAGTALLFPLGLGFCLALQHQLWATAAVAVLFALLAWVPLLDEGWRAPPPAAAPPVIRAEADRRRLEHVLNHAPTPLVVVGADGRIETLNRAARRLLGAETPPALLEAAGALTPGGRALVRLPRDGALRTHAVTCAELLDGEGLQRLLALTDIEAELRAVEAETLKETLDVVSHEIMNSLTPVTSLAGTALAFVEQDDRAGASDALSTLERRAGGLLRFVEGYRALARLPQPSKRRVVLTELARDVARLQPPETRLELAVEDLWLEADPDLLAQALLNLLKNAREALPTGGEGRVKLSAIPAGRGIEISVADNGAGLGGRSAADIEKPFYTTKPGGAGIGLALARQIALAHGGELVIAEPGLEGRGLTVTLRLPV